MATWQQWKEVRNLDRVETNTTARFILVDRPIIIHAVGDGGDCTCGCGSPIAKEVERRPHIMVLFNRVTGKRKLRTEKNAESFDAWIAKRESSIKRIYLPARVYADQLDILLDRESKIIGVFGGNRSGKSQIAGEKLVDEILIDGGRRRTFWWVAPSREKVFDVAVAKLVHGETTNREAPPLIPPELVRYIPTSPQNPRQYILLIDGTKIELKYASRKGANLKGGNARFIVLDEGTEVQHEINWTILLNRLMDTGGRIVVATTPVAGHWLRECVFDRGRRYGEAGDGDIAVVELSCRSNPWISPAEVERTIEALGGEDDPRVKREVFGQWITDGFMLWRHFTPRRHVFEGLPRDLGYYGYTDITPTVVRHLFPEGRVDMICGMDFNDFPMSLLTCHVGVKEGDDQADPRNWHLFVMDEVVKRATIHGFAEFLRKGAPRVRRLGEDWLEGVAIIGDANACYANTRVNRLGKSADAGVLREAGFYVEPPAYHQTGEPKNPAIRDRVNLMHELMHTDRLHIHGSRCTKVLESVNSQEADGKGLPIKDPGKASDRLSGPTDALGYVACAIFGAPLVAGEVVW